MKFSRQEDSRTDGRANQRARTRSALVDAAGQLLREGRAPSIPEAAERALVSVATAYRYFGSADELWAEAATDLRSILHPEGIEAAVEAAGDDVELRLDAAIRSVVWPLVDHELVARQAVRTGLERWFEGQGATEPVAALADGRNGLNELVVAPLRGELDDARIDALVEALGVMVGPENVVTLIDVLHLTPEAAKERILTTARWLLHRWLAEASA
jgi:AcrR family transcriptional regulator